MTALIPARAGSKRLPGKNIRRLDGHPVLAYTITVARQSRLFDHVYCCSEHDGILQIADRYGAERFLRSPQTATDHAPDILWVREFLKSYPTKSFAILRPTAPFRTVAMLKAARKRFEDSDCDSLRAVEPVRQHPGKMWRVVKGYLDPIWIGLHEGTPWHSCPTQLLPPVYVQNASLEMAHTARTVDRTNTIAGEKVIPFVTSGYEGFDLNTDDDWTLATALIREGRVALPTFGVAPLPPAA